MDARADLALSRSKGNSLLGILSIPCALVAGTGGLVAVGVIPQLIEDLDEYLSASLVRSMACWVNALVVSVSLAAVGLRADRRKVFAILVLVLSAASLLILIVGIRSLGG